MYNFLTCLRYDSYKNKNRNALYNIIKQYKLNTSQTLIRTFTNGNNLFNSDNAHCTTIEIRAYSLR
jgi:hypothetical protein